MKLPLYPYSERMTLWGSIGIERHDRSARPETFEQQLCDRRSTLRDVVHKSGPVERFTNPSRNPTKPFANPVLVVDVRFRPMSHLYLCALGFLHSL